PSPCRPAPKLSRQLNNIDAARSWLCSGRAVHLPSCDGGPRPQQWFVIRQIRRSGPGNRGAPAVRPGRAADHARGPRAPRRRPGAMSPPGGRISDSGGERFTAGPRADDAVEAANETLTAPAPSHTPRRLVGMRIARAESARQPNVVGFDTAFHQTVPPHAY